MEAAEPVKFMTPRKTELIYKINFIEELIIKKDREIYQLQFGIKENNNEMIIKVSSDNYHKAFYFQQSFTLEELQSLSKIFTVYESAKDVILFLKQLKIDIGENNEELAVKFNAFMPDGKNKIIELNLKKIVLDNNVMIKFLSEEIQSIKNNNEKEIKAIKNKHITEIKSLQDNILKYQNEITFLKTNILNYQNEITHSKQENKKLWEEIKNLKKMTEKIIQKENSKINYYHFKTIDSLYSIDFIFNYIRQKDPLFHFSNIKLLYRGSSDGALSITCHKLCDNKQNVLIIIKSDIGYIFGGYSKIGFKTNNDDGDYLIDNNAFLFSVNLQKIYPAINNAHVICHTGNMFGLCFNNSLVFYDSFMSRNDNIIYSEIRTMFNGFNNNYEMNGGRETFRIDELEVFQLI